MIWVRSARGFRASCGPRCQGGLSLDDSSSVQLGRVAIHSGVVTSVHDVHSAAAITIGASGPQACNVGPNENSVSKTRIFHVEYIHSGFRPVWAADCMYSPLVPMAAEYVWNQHGIDDFSQEKAGAFCSFR